MSTNSPMVMVHSSATSGTPAPAGEPKMVWKVPTCGNRFDSVPQYTAIIAAQTTMTANLGARCLP